VSSFWAKYAVGLLKRGVNHITGPRFKLQKSKTDM
jgi:hypothetical protein